MIVVRLPAPPSPMPDLVVDPDGIDDCGAELLAASAQVDDLGSFVAGPARLDDWTGTSARTYRARIRTIGRGADAMSLALRGVARRVDAHAIAMRSSRDQHDDLARTEGFLANGVSVLGDDVARATPALYDVLQSRADGLALSVADYERDLRAWSARVAVEERAMVAAFEQMMTLDQVDARYSGDPDPADAALDTRPEAGSSPDDVHAWWLGLSLVERRAIIAAAPGAIGNLDGIPAGARHEANTVALDRDLAALRTRDETGAVSDEERRALDNALAVDDARHRIEARHDPVTDERLSPQLYLYDPYAFGGEGAVAICVGDLDRADNVAVIVPGLGTDGTSAGSQADRAADVHEASRTSDPDASNATLVWIGYDAPDTVGVMTEGLAERGGDHLAATIDGLRAGRDGDPAHLTVIGHSYGSTTVGHAAHDHGLDVDDVVFVGSPGVGGDTHHAVDLGVDPDHVWSGANSSDPVVHLGNHGSLNLGTLGGAGLGDDPAEDDFGGTRFQAESTTRGDGLNPFDDHNEYFDHGSESLANIAHVIAGDYDQVTEADPVTDSWWRGPDDPEAGRQPTSTQTLPRAS